MINNKTNETNTEINTIKIFKEIGLPIIFIIIILSCSITCKYLIKFNIKQSITKHFLPKKNNIQHIEEILNDESSDDTPIPSKICSASQSFECIESYKI